MDPVQLASHLPSAEPAALGNTFPRFYSAKQLPHNTMSYSSEWDEVHQLPLKQKLAGFSPALQSQSDKNRFTPRMLTPNRPGTAGSKLEQTEPTPGPEPTRSRNVAPIDVFWAMVNDITGKDKLAKFGQYSLRLVLHHLKQTEAYLSDDKLNIARIAKTYHGTDKILDLMVKFLRSPRSFARVVIILMCSTITLRLSGLAPALGLYRQLLRFGKSPFRIVALVKKVRNHTFYDAKASIWRMDKSFYSKRTLGELIALYYSFNDDLLLLFRLKFLRNATWKRLAARHEAYAWYCDSWLALYNAWHEVQDLSRQEMDMEIQIRVKHRARALSKELLGGQSLGFSMVDDDASDQQALKDIQFKKANAVLDIYKTLSDIIFNSYTVFQVKIPFPTLQIWMGISASLLSSVKLYRQKKQILQKSP